MKPQCLKRHHCFLTLDPKVVVKLEALAKENRLYLGQKFTYLDQVRFIIDEFLRDKCTGKKARK